MSWSGDRGSVSMASYLPVAQFYNDRSIFVTGGTGFMGKVLVEKLLRSCPGIQHIYLLMRPKSERDLASRLTELTNSPLFDRIRQERPTDLRKIVPIAGDITKEKLGISEDDQNLLIRKVSVVFHSAATVKFDEELRLSVTINMLGTRRLVELCHRMLKLDALIHVSTAYCNCDRQEVEEKVYEPPYLPDYIIKCVECMDEELISFVTPKLIGNRPNTYTFTKALAENMLMNDGGDLPICIVRPSIVVSSHKEPVAGWVDNWNGPTGLIAAAGKGFFRTMYGNPNATADFVPVDMVINLMIVAAWRTATERENGTRRGGVMKVYNCVSGIQNPITWGQFVDTCLVHWRSHPLSGAIWPPGGYVTHSSFLNQFYILLYHRLPSYVFDTVAFLTGRKPFMRSICSRLEKAGATLRIFTGQNWRFYDDNMKQLNEVLSDEDRAVFNFDICKVNWVSFLENYVIGIRKFIFKETEESFPTARRHLERLQWLSRFTQLAAIYLFWRLFLSKTMSGRRIGLILLDCLLRVYRMIPYV